MMWLKEQDSPPAATTPVVETGRFNERINFSCKGISCTSYSTPVTLVSVESARVTGVFGCFVTFYCEHTHVLVLCWSHDVRRQTFIIISQV